MIYPVKSRTFREPPWSLYVYVLSVAALIVYLYGFFPIEYSSNFKLQKSNVHITDFGPRRVDKLAFIVIDALRKDFIIPRNDEEYMPFTHSAIQNKKACLITTKAHSPTVTMPRLKAITSGSISTYIDVVLNFMTADFKQDNFINIAASNGLKLVFYGDDTWLKLFPNAFVRSEGTTSFFALDYVEVDNNVTRHIDAELKKTDWDIIILHYLGLDHIGHTKGPSSPLMKPKLQEMDNIVKQFSDHFMKLEQNKGLKTMLIVTGDHGMKDSGGHGGVSYSEITVPLVALGNPCVALPGWPDEHTPFQIDIASTLSVLLGQRIPVHNMGKIIPNLLHGMNSEDILKYLELNRLQLKTFENRLNEDHEMNLIMRELENWNLKKDKTVIKYITKKYFQYLDQYSQEIVKSNSGFKQFYLFLGIVFLWIFLTILLLQTLKECPKPQNMCHWHMIAGTILHGMSTFSSSFIEEEHQTWYFMWATFCVLSILESSSLKKLSNRHRARSVIPWIILAMAHRFLRKLNQTGDKWAFLPDIKLYLNTEGQGWLFFLFLLGMGLIFWCAASDGCPFIQLLSFGVTLCSVIGYRIVTGSFQLSILNFHNQSKGTSEILLFWVFFVIFTLQTFHYKTSMYLVWLLLASLLLRPHNVILLPVEVFASKELNKLFSRTEDAFWNNIAHVWMGYLFYFYQGNGNSLSNIDVASGFTGIQSYNPIYAGIMMVAHTTNGHILAFLLSPKINLAYALTRLIPLTLYCTALLFHLHHLFIWSVFSPKLLYEANTTVVFMMLMLFNSLISICNP